MKSARVLLIPALLVLSAVLAWGDAALRGQEVRPRQTTKLDPGLLRARSWAVSASAA